MTIEKMHLAAIALGSNVGDRRAHLEYAVRRLGEIAVVRAVSRFYETAPVGYLEQPEFLNAAAVVETDLGPVELLRALLGIERERGRDRSRTVAKGPRTLDLDLLLYDDLVMETAELVLPHPEMAGRRFVLEPLAEIAADWVHPVLGKTVGELFGDVDDVR